MTTAYTNLKKHSQLFYKATKVLIIFLGTKEMYYPYQVKGKIVRRGDYTKLYTDAKKEDDEYSVVMFLNRKWKKNDYGELYLYVRSNI